MPVKSTVLVQLPLPAIVNSLLPVVIQTHCQSVVCFLQTRHSLRSVQELLYFFRNLAWQSVKVDKEAVRGILLEVVVLVNVTLTCKNVLIKLHKHLNLPELFQRNFCGF